MEAATPWTALVTFLAVGVSGERVHAIRDKAPKAPQTPELFLDLGYRVSNVTDLIHRGGQQQPNRDYHRDRHEKQHGRQGGTPLPPSSSEELDRWFASP